MTAATPTALPSAEDAEVARIAKAVDGLLHLESKMSRAIANSRPYPVSIAIGDDDIQRLLSAAVQLERCRAALQSPRASDEVLADAGGTITAELLGEVMQDAWGEICDDAGAHPSDMKHGRGSVLHYSPHHWTALIALRLNERLAAFADTPPPAAAGDRSLAEALLPFTSHDIGCAVYQRSWIVEPPCTCGLERARALALRTPEPNSGGEGQ
jgi:hypothetical protein